MKKIVLSMMLVASLFAENNDYVTLGGGVTQFNLDTGPSNASTNNASYTFALGHQYGNYGRIHMDGTYINAASASIDSSAMISLSYDFMFPVVDDIFSLYVGPVGGYTSYKTNTYDLSGGHYGVELGGVVSITENFELELGASYLKETGAGVSTFVSLDDARSVYFHINYLFDGTKHFRY